MSHPEAIRYTVGQSASREAQVRQSLDAFNAEFRSGLLERLRDGWPGPQPLQVYALDHEDRLVGGLIGQTHAVPMWSEVSILWVDEAYRGHGIGRRLMDEAEARSIEAGCEALRLTTSSFQGSGFYERLGYQHYGRLNDCPPGEDLHFYFKRLNSRSLSD